MKKKIKRSEEKSEKKPKFITFVPGRTNQWRMSFYEPDDKEPTLSLRKFFLPEDKDEFLPTKMGVNMSPETVAKFYLSLGEMLRSKKAFRIALKKAEKGEEEEGEEEEGE